MSNRIEEHHTSDQLATWRSLDTPRKIQDFLDSTAYSPEYDNRCPASVMRDRRAHCLDGAIFGAAALRRLGFRPLVVDMFPDPGMDDDHVLAVFSLNGRLGACAKSNFIGLRYREPVYRDLRELLMAYFEQFYNVDGVKTLRTHTRLVDLARYDALDWEWSDRGADGIEKLLLSRKRYALVTPEMTANLSPVDELNYKAGLLAANFDGLYKPKG